MSLIYWFFSHLSKWVLAIFFRSIKHLHANRIPKTRKPLLIVANHPSDMVDALLIATSVSDRMVHFWAKATLFKVHTIAYFLKSIGMIPVRRRSDFVQKKPESPSTTTPPKMMDNSALYETSLTLLKNNGTILLFPEGTSHSQLGLKPLKDGASFTALEFIKKYNQPIDILPVGINYIGEKATWKCDVVIEWGNPITISPERYLHSFLEDKKTTAKNLTKLLIPALRSVIVDSSQLVTSSELSFNKPTKTSSSSSSKGWDSLAKESVDSVRAIHLGRELYFNSSESSSSKADDPVHTILVTQEIIKITLQSLQSGDRALLALRNEMLSYSSSLEKLGLSDENIAPSGAWGLRSQIRSFFIDLIISIVFSPILLPGFFIHLPLYYTAHFAGKLTPHSESKSTRQIVITLFFFPVYSALIWIGLSYFFQFSIKTTLLISVLAFIIWLSYCLYLVKFSLFINRLKSFPFFLSAILGSPRKLLKLRDTRTDLYKKICDFMAKNPSVSNIPLPGSPSLT